MGRVIKTMFNVFIFNARRKDRTWCNWRKNHLPPIFFYKDCPGTKCHLWSARSWVRASKKTSPLLVLKWSNVMCLFILVAICESVICMEFSLQRYRPRANIKKTAQAGANLGSFGFRLFSLLRLRLLFFYLFHSKLKICHRRKFDNNVMCICM